ncbi:MAG TPA: hypothetical protein VLC09_17585 [Polyangiaceae bacterium]|nr:hypothetical protein [Polyangiaceae bacterium]
MDAQPNRTGRRRRRKKTPQQKAPAVEPVIVAARRPGSPRLEKPTRRMKAASARPRTRDDGVSLDAQDAPSREAQAAEAPKRREARIVQRRTDEIDEREKNRRRLFSQFMASEGRSAITRAADTYLTAGFTLPREQDAQLKLLEHFNEVRAHEAILVLTELLRDESPRQLPLFRQRLRRLEDHAEDANTREAARDLRRVLPA